ncbi:hypothetical protein KAS08_04245 [Candidatus Pacearchaeota archaeon]|nr:hypothetical protein [Candidatus Pacearchaeota archaeon]
MGVLLLLIAITAFFIPVISSIYLLKKHKAKTLKPHDLLTLPISITYLIFAIITFFWSMGLQQFTLEKLTTLLASLIIIQTISLILILSKIQKNKKITYQIPLLLLSIIPALINKSYLHITIPVAFLITIMTFLTFIDEHKHHITILIAYASISLMFYLSAFISTKPTLILTLISTTIFLLFFAEFLKTLFVNKKPKHYPAHLQSSPIIPFLKHLIFIIIITNFVFIGTVAVHELGHAVSAQISDCEGTKIVYEMNGFPHTEINCEDESQKQIWILSGILLPIAIALLLMFSGGTSIKEIALEIIGFSLAIAYLDIQALGIPKSIAIIVTIFGISLSILGLVLLAKSRTK